MYDVYTGMLKLFNEFQDDGKKIVIQYFTGNNEKLQKQYPLKEIAGEGDSYSKARRLMKWESEHIYHKGDYNNTQPDDAVALFHYSFNQDAEHGINCRALSIALTECLLALGMKARTVYLMPASPYDQDNHVVSEIWDEKREKWILLDPTYCLSVETKEGEPLGILEIRNLLAEQKKLYLAEGVNYNGNPCNPEEIMEYYAKNFFYFKLSEKQGKLTELNPNRSITIAPKGMDQKKRSFGTVEFYIRKFGESESLLKWKKEIEMDFPIYKGTDILK